MKTKKNQAGRDFSGAPSSRARGLARHLRLLMARRWGLYLLVGGLHIMAIAGLNAALTLNRLAPLQDQVLEVALLPVAPTSPQPFPVLAPAPEPSVMQPPDRFPAPPAPLDLPIDLSGEVSASSPTSSDALIAADANIPQAAQVQTLPVAPSEALSKETLPATPLEKSAEKIPTVTLNAQQLRVALPPDGQLRYVVRKDTDTAKASLAWHRREAQAEYEMTYEATYFGISIIKQISRGTWSASGFAPVRFSDKRRGRSEQATHFQRDRQVVTFSSNTPEAALLPLAQDRASFLLQLASFLAAQPALFQPGQVLELPVASVHELERWIFEVHAKETLALPQGAVEAIRLVRRPRRAFDQMVEVWFAPALFYLPVRIRLVDSSGTTDSELLEFQPSRPE